MCLTGQKCFRVLRMLRSKGGIRRELRVLEWLTLLHATVTLNNVSPEKGSFSRWLLSRARVSKIRATVGVLL